MSIYSVGCTPEVAIRALCDSRRVRFGGRLEPLADYRGTTYEWGFRFMAGDRPCKAAGIMVPGGCVLTWWK